MADCGLARMQFAAVTPIIKGVAQKAGVEVEPEMVGCGAVISRPGAGEQRFHFDASFQMFQDAAADPTRRIYNLFIPLVDISKDGDGTMFFPSAPDCVKSTQAVARHFLAPPDERAPYDTSKLEAPACRAGGLMLFDYRTIHRGLPSTGRERAVAYVTVATGGAVDDHNFPPVAPQSLIPAPVPPQIRFSAEWDYVLRAGADCRRGCGHAGTLSVLDRSP